MTAAEFPGSPEDHRDFLNAVKAWCTCHVEHRCPTHVAMLHDRGFASRWFDARARRVELNVSEFTVKP